MKKSLNYRMKWLKENKLLLKNECKERKKKKNRHVLNKLKNRNRKKKNKKLNLSKS